MMDEFRQQIEIQDSIGIAFPDIRPFVRFAEYFGRNDAAVHLLQEIALPVAHAQSLFVR